MASAVSKSSAIPLLAGRIHQCLRRIKVISLICLVRGPSAVQLVTSPAHQDEITKVEVFNIENCRLTCFSRSGHQFVISTKDE